MVQSLMKHNWTQGRYNVSLEQQENGMYIAEVKHESDGFVGGIVCETANEAHRFIAGITQD